MTKKATVIETTMSVKKYEREQHDFNGDWNSNFETQHILGFELSSDRNKNFLGEKEDEANEQHKSNIKRSCPRICVRTSEANGSSSRNLRQQVFVKTSFNYSVAIYWRKVKVKEAKLE